jgi:hypothetical protein
VKLVIVILTFILISCGQTTEEEVRDAIEEANLLLSSYKCDEALTILNEVGMQNTNKDYLDSLSTAYACKGNYSTTTFFTTDLPNISTASNSLFGSLASFSSANDMASATDTSFTSIQTAIDILLHAGGHATASSTLRSSSFTTREATDLNLQALYMILVNMGRWFNYYGNADSVGVKGSGAEPNTCLATYTDANAIVAIDVVNSDTCNSGTNLGHTSIEGASRTTRLCQGIVLYNNFIDTLSNIEFTGTDASTFDNIETAFSGVCLAASALSSFSASMCDVRDQSICETQTNIDIERFSASIFETGFL